MQRRVPDHSTRIMMAISAVSAGLIHLALATPPRFQASQAFGQGADATGIFFAALAIFQLIWAVIALLQIKHRIIMLIGITGFLLSIIIYFVALVTPLPFGVPQLRAIPYALATKALETIFVVGALGKLATK
jgi:hypothetical protein